MARKICLDGKIYPKIAVSKCYPDFPNFLSFIKAIPALSMLQNAKRMMDACFYVGYDTAIRIAVQTIYARFWLQKEKNMLTTKIRLVIVACGMVLTMRAFVDSA